jgi:hypothetical protein
MSAPTSAARGCGQTTIPFTRYATAGSDTPTR